ncbi:MAG: hypothetical protein WBP26_02585 [Candidatus Saccharimonadales bacterium]
MNYNTVRGRGSAQGWAAWKGLEPNDFEQNTPLTPRNTLVSGKAPIAQWAGTATLETPDPTWAAFEGAVAHADWAHHTSEGVFNDL